MPPEVMTWRGDAERGHEEAVARAVDGLLSGGTVVLPTETVYGLFGLASNTASLARLRSTAEARHGTADAPLVWHAPTVHAVADRVALPTRMHRRLLTRLLPGPVRFDIEQNPDEIATFCAEGDLEPGSLDDGSRVSIRVPRHGATSRILADIPLPVAAVGLGELPDDGDADLIIDAGRIPGGKASTGVAIERSGRFRVTELGYVTEADVLDALHRRVLFVCTGNTCRSPMAEAIARGLLRERTEDGIETHVASAGVATVDGLDATPEAVEAVHGLGFSMPAHASRRLTRAMLEEAEAVFCMTAAHADAAVAVLPGAEWKITVLDPARDVPDPIGLGEEVYRETAARIREAVSLRLAELDAALDNLGSATRAAETDR